MRLLVSALAREDLNDIFRYGAERWSRAQAERYQRALRASMTFCTRFPAPERFA